MTVLALMNKPSVKTLMRFRELFENACRTTKKRYFMTYYLMAAHPGCTLDHMRRLKNFLKGALKHFPEQVQIFTPTPSTLSAAMYFCETDPAGAQDILREGNGCERTPERTSPPFTPITANI